MPLTLKTLCGLSAKEIANALLTNESTINKRLYRAKRQFREGEILFEIPAQVDLAGRIDGVLLSLYLYLSVKSHLIETTFSVVTLSRLTKNLIVDKDNM